MPERTRKRPNSGFGSASIPPVGVLKSSPSPPVKEDWKDELRTVLNDSFQKQLVELHLLCEGMRYDAKEEMRHFLNGVVGEPSAATVVRAASSQEEEPLDGEAALMVVDEEGNLCFAEAEAPYDPYDRQVSFDSKVHDDSEVFHEEPTPAFTEQLCSPPPPAPASSLRKASAQCKDMADHPEVQAPPMSFLSLRPKVQPVAARTFTSEGPFSPLSSEGKDSYVEPETNGHGADLHIASGTAIPGMMSEDDDLANLTVANGHSTGRITRQTWQSQQSIEPVYEGFYEGLAASKPQTPPTSSLVHLNTDADAGTIETQNLVRRPLVKVSDFDTEDTAQDDRASLAYINPRGYSSSASATSQSSVSVPNITQSFRDVCLRRKNAVRLSQDAGSHSKEHRRREIMRAMKTMDFPAVEGEKTARGNSCFGCIFEAAENVVDNLWFDYAMGALLLLNAICLGISANAMAVDKLEEPPPLLRTIDMSFMTVFTVELLMRVLAFRTKFFKIAGWRWNVFDLLIVVLGWAEEILKRSVQDTEFLDQVGPVRLLRLGRIARLVRMVRLIPELQSMVYLIAASMSSFFWTLVLMIMVIFCMSVYFTELAADMLRNGTAKNAIAEEELSAFWGSIGQSTLTLYMGITGGDDWQNFIKPFEGGSQYLTTTMVFGLYIAFATLVMLNLVTGVFVEGAQRIIREDKDNEIMNMAAKLFLEADDDDSQDITSEEWNFQLTSGKLDEYIQVVGITRCEAGRLFDLLDTDSSGTVNIAEFVRGCLRLRGPAKAMDTADMLHRMKQQSLQTHDLIFNLRETVEQISRNMKLKPSVVFPKGSKVSVINRGSVSSNGHLPGRELLRASLRKEPPFPPPPPIIFEECLV